MNTLTLSTLLRFVLPLLLATTPLALAADKIRVVTTLPDLADFARAIGQELVTVESLATGTEDPHGIPMKPSFVTRLNRADLLIVLGLENEHAYLPGLLETASNPGILPGSPGYIDTSKNIPVLEVPASLDRAEGERHPAGNPHYNLDPVLAKTIVRNICDGFVRHAPQHATAFQSGRDAYLAALDAKIPEWQALARQAPGLKFVSYHAYWPYFCTRFGFTAAGTIELKPGISPTPKHLEALINRMRAEQISIVVREPQFAEKVPQQVAAKAGARLVKLAIMVGGVPQARTYIDLIDYNLRTLVGAAR